MAIALSEDDLKALEAVVATETGTDWDGDTLDLGAAAIVDTIINRVSHPAYPDTISDVINQWAQFSDINSVQNTAYGSWDKVPETRMNAANKGKLRAAVQKAVAERAAGVTSSVDGHLNYGNYKVARARGWPAAKDGEWLDVINDAPYLRVGSGSQEHVHGTDHTMRPLKSAPTVGFHPALENLNPGIDDREIFKAPNGLDRVAPPVPTPKNGEPVSNPMREMLLERIENPVDLLTKGPTTRPRIFGWGGPPTPTIYPAGTEAQAAGKAPVTPVTRVTLPDLVPKPAVRRGSPHPETTASPADFSDQGVPLARGPSQRLGPRGSTAPTPKGPPQRRGPRGSSTPTPSGPPRRNGPRRTTFGPPIKGAGQPSNVGASHIFDDTAPQTIEQMRDMLGQSPKPPIDYGRPAPAPTPSRAPTLSRGPSQRLGPRGSRAATPAPVPAPRPTSRQSSVNQDIIEAGVPTARPQPVPSKAPVVGVPMAKPNLAPRRPEDLPMIDANTINGIGIPQPKPEAPKKTKKGSLPGKLLGGVAGGVLLGPIGVVPGAWAGNKIAQKGLPNLKMPNLNLGPIISKEGFGRTPSGRAVNAATRNGGFDNYTFTKTYANSGGSRDPHSYARALADEQRQRSRAGQKTVGSAFRDEFSGFFG